MGRTLATGNHAAGHTLALAGEANRHARGCCAGAYPITPQTEIIEFLSGFKFNKGRIVLVESEHSAMGVCIGAALAGARTFTASSSNGLAYMTENIFAAGYYRLPTVMIAVNRTLGPPWNIWVDQGDSLMMRDAAWLQFYCDSHQDLVDTILLAFRVAEDHAGHVAGDRRHGWLCHLAHADGGRSVRHRSRSMPSCRRVSSPTG